MHKKYHIKPETVTINYYQLPTNVLEQYRNITICTDIMKVNELAFYVTISRHLKFTMVELITDHTVDILHKCMEHIHYLYKRCGFNVTTLHTDGEFKFIANNLRKLYIDINVTAACEHVPEVEHQIRVIKE